MTWECAGDWRRSAAECGWGGDPWPRPLTRGDPSAGVGDPPNFNLRTTSSTSSSSSSSSLLLRSSPFCNLLIPATRRIIQNIIRFAVLNIGISKYTRTGGEPKFETSFSSLPILLNNNRINSTLVMALDQNFTRCTKCQHFYNTSSFSLHFDRNLDGIAADIHFEVDIVGVTKTTPSKNYNTDRRPPMIISVIQWIQTRNKDLFQTARSKSTILSQNAWFHCRYIW